MPHPRFQAFLSYNRADTPAVEELARRLKSEGISCWFDKWNLIPADSFDEAIETALNASEVYVVFIGPSGAGPWQYEDMHAAIRRRLKDSPRSFRIVPVVLPGAQRLAESQLPLFLQALTWVEFKSSLEEAESFERLMSGILGRAPRILQTEAPLPISRTARPNPEFPQAQAPPISRTATPKVFISYSHKDDTWKRMIRSQLSKFTSDGHFTLWDDSQIAPGADWAKELERQRNEASAVLMLISDEYLKSQSVRIELRHLLEQKERRDLRFLPILVSPCKWQNEDWLEPLQIYPEKARPLSEMSSTDQRAAMLKFAEAFMAILGISPSEMSRPEAFTAKNEKRLVILVHGIRTRAEWQGRLKYLFEADGKTIVEPVGYEYFDVFRFLFPFWTRRAPVKTVLRKLRTALTLHEDKYEELVIVAHSFGTFIVGKILFDEFDIRPRRLLLCGCIQPSSFAWERLPNRPPVILNEAGSRDIWPILAKSITWGYGSTGTFGFQTPGVRDRFHDLTHSDYFKVGFAEEYWVPWIHDGVAKPTPFETGPRPPTPFYKNLFEVIPLKWLLLALMGLVVYLITLQIRKALMTGGL